MPTNGVAQFFRLRQQSWQIVPKMLTALTMDPNPQKAASVFGAMLKMKKLDIAALERAAEG
jgi:hypothetical protein